MGSTIAADARDVAHAIARQRDLALRSALGASATQLVRQSLVESLLLAGVALVASTIASTWMVRMLVALAPATVPRLTEVGTGVETLMASAGLALVIGVALAVVPAWVAAHADVRAVLHDGVRGSAGVSRAGTRLRTTRIPLGSSNVTTSVRAEGNTAPPAALPEVEFRRGSPDYFRAMGIPLTRGRGFLTSDLPTDPGWS